VHDLHTPFFNYELVKRALTFGIEGSDAQRELISRLLSLLYGEQSTHAVGHLVGTAGGSLGHVESRGWTPRSGAGAPGVLRHELAAPLLSAPWGTYGRCRGAYRPSCPR